MAAVSSGPSLNSTPHYTQKSATVLKLNTNITCTGLSVGVLLSYLRRLSYSYSYLPSYALFNDARSIETNSAG
jgi:hypothetical protein